MREQQQPYAKEVQPQPEPVEGAAAATAAAAVLAAAALAAKAELAIQQVVEDEEAIVHIARAGAQPGRAAATAEWPELPATCVPPPTTPSNGVVCGATGAPGAGGEASPGGQDAICDFSGSLQAANGTVCGATGAPGAGGDVSPSTQGAICADPPALTHLSGFPGGRGVEVVRTSPPPLPCVDPMPWGIRGLHCF